MDKNKLSFTNRIKLCWNVLIKGKYNPKDYKTTQEQEQWEICEKRRKEMQAHSRSRTDFHHKDELFEQ
tara:strand:- start:706 stop:909 length:204 start_codon:yes stop_codon:yes gene_type:complete